MPAPSAALPENQLRELMAVLVRRRAWWIAPLAAGIVVGVALVVLVPRRFVVRTSIEILPTYAEELTSRGRETTIDKELATVQNELKAHTRVRRVLEEDVPTPEFAVLPEAARLQYIEAAVSRIDVRLVPQTRSGGEVVIGEFRDHEKFFAADFLNALFKRWMADTKNRLLAGILDELQRRNGREADRRREYEAAHQLVIEHLRRNSLPPELATGSLSYSPDPTYTRAEMLRKEFADRARELDVSEARLAVTKEQRDAIEPTLDVSAIPSLGLARRPTDAKELEYRSKIQELERKLAGLKPLNSHYRLYAAEKERLEKALDEYLRFPLLAAGSGPSRAENPRWREKDAEAKSLEQKVAGLKREVENLRAELRGVEDLAAGRSSLYATLEFLKAGMREKEAALTKAIEEQRHWRDLYEKVDETNPYEVLYGATPPSQPTEPDPLTLFALSVLVAGGLGLGLASLREYGRSAYRTLEDAARSLPIPVLGAVAWVRTEIERRRSRRRRLVAALATSSAAVLIMAVFVTYSVKPEALPTSLSAFLDGIKRSLR